MKILVIYNSQTGFAKRYAERIVAAGADCHGLSVANRAGNGKDDFCIL